MKTNVVLAAIAALAAASAFAETPKAAIVIQQPDFEKLTDLANGIENKADVWSAFAREATDGLVGPVDRLVPGGSLELQFSDFNRAGEVQPWRNPSFSDVRYVEEIYPPSAEISYVLKDASGGVLAEGKTRVRDPNFLIASNIAQRSRTFFYEVEMLRGWVEGDLAKQVARPKS
jgi:hypothetical protein